MTNESAILGLLAELYADRANLLAEVQRLTQALAEREQAEQPN